MDFVDLNSLRSVAELNAYQTDVRQRLTELNTEHAGLPFPDEAREEFANLQSADKEIDDRKTELEARDRYINSLAERPGNVERVEEPFKAPRTTSRESDIYDLSTIRTSVSNPEAANREIRDRAMRANEIARYWAAEDRSQAQERVEDLLDRDDTGAVAKHILITGSPTYRSAWFKHFAGMPLTNAEATALTSQRALSLTGSAGGFAVPFELDPTIIPTSNSSVNPFRADRPRHPDHGRRVARRQFGRDHGVLRRRGD
jgi:hypothetical protein